ncbi:hypothetical protein T10_1374, partial [Trichinella papuae]
LFVVTACLFRIINPQVHKLLCLIRNACRVSKSQPSFGNRVY